MTRGGPVHGSSPLGGDVIAPAFTARGLTIASALPMALERREVSAHFQPIVDLSSGRIVQLEAFARWESPSLGAVSPLDLIAVAEEVGLLSAVSIRILRDALERVAGARAGGWPAMRVAVYVSPLELEDERFVNTVASALTANNLSGAALELELTTGKPITDIVAAVATIRRLRDLGVTVVLDDFGTGHTDMDLLLELPVAGIKIGRNFIAGICTNSVDYSIVRHLIAFSREAGATVVAEGVETLEQHHVLIELGCNAAQGFLYSPPRPAPIALDPIPFGGGRAPGGVVRRVPATAAESVALNLAHFAAASCGAPVGSVTVDGISWEWSQGGPRVGPWLRDPPGKRVFVSLDDYLPGHTGVLCVSGFGRPLSEQQRHGLQLLAARAGELIAEASRVVPVSETLVEVLAELALDVLEDAVIVLDVAGNVTFWNPPAGPLFGERLAARVRFVDLVEPADRAVASLVVAHWLSSPRRLPDRVELRSIAGRRLELLAFNDVADTGAGGVLVAAQEIGASGATGVTALSAAFDVLGVAPGLSESSD